MTIKTAPEYVRPDEIEARSMAIISEELGERHFDPLQEPVIKRVIHTTADFDYADNLRFSENAVPDVLTVFDRQPVLITDTQMAMAGINKKAAADLGIELHCFMADPDVADAAKAAGTTRAQASMEKAARLYGKSERSLIFAIGNAPTALIALNELIINEQIRPALIIGVPVGFVNVVYAKELIMTAGVPYIVAAGRKGGSNVAAAIVNALLYLKRGSRR